LEAASIALVIANEFLLLDAAHRHAQVRRLEHHPDAERLEVLSRMVSAIWRGHPLLDLEAAREEISTAVGILLSRSLPVGDVGDVAPAEERRR